MPPTAVSDSDQREKQVRRILRGRLEPLPSKPKGEKDAPDTRTFVRKVADLENADDVLSSLRARAEHAAEYRARFEPEWRQAVRAWFQRPSTDREDSWESDRYLPMILKHVETCVPSLVAATLDGTKVWKMVALTRQFKEAARALTTLCNWQAYTVSEVEEAIEDLYWWAALIGTAYIDHYWDFRVERRMVPNVRLGQTGEKVKEMTEQDVEVANHPVMRCLNPMDVLPSPDARMGDDAEWFFEYVRTTIGALREAAGEGHIDGEALEDWIAEDDPGAPGSADRWATHLANGTWDQWISEIGYEGRDDALTPGDFLSAEKVVTVLRYRSKAEIITLGSPKHLIGYSLNPYAHGKTGIVIHQFFKVPDSPFGRGVGTILLGHQELANENINRWMDTAAVEASAPIIVDRSAVSILDDEFVLEPNKLIRSSRGVDAIKRLEVPAPTNLAMLMDRHLAGDADDLTGFSEQARGASPMAGQTATAFQGLQSNLRTRLMLMVRRAARTLRKSGDLFVSLNQQFMTSEQIVEQVGEDAENWVTIKPEEIVGKVRVHATLNASRASPDQRSQRLMGLTQVCVPLFTSGAINDPRIARWVRMLLDEEEIEDADLIMPRIPTGARDPAMENQILKRGGPLDPMPLENHAMHVEVHMALFEELTAAGLVGAASVVLEHANKHLLMAAAQAQQAGGQPGGGGAPAPGGGGQQAPAAGTDAGGRNLAERGGGETSGGAARNGTPGVKSPGPASAPGRPS
jgi:hypothetical protein